MRIVAPSRQSVAALVLAATLALLPLTPGAAAPASCWTPVVRDLATQLRPLLGDADVAGLPPREAAWVLYPVTRERELPHNYEPPDLVWTTAGGPAIQGRQGVRELILPDLEAMFAAARRESVTLAIYSGYRSFGTQQLAFDGGVAQQLARGVASRAEAEERANRFRARPGHSQHQLGTTVDLTAPDVGWRLTQAFGDTAAGQWLRANAWQYGFVVPYTAEGEPYTGYAAEPWHLRWVGRPLAARMMAEGYLDRAQPTPDDYLLALDALLGGIDRPCDSP